MATGKAKELLERIAARRLANPTAFALELAEKEQEPADLENKYRTYEFTPFSRPYLDLPLFLAFWKWRLLHPAALNEKDFSYILDISGEITPGTFKTADTVRFLPFLKAANLTELNIITSMLYMMEFSVPASLHQELFDFLVANKQASQDREGGG